MVRPRAFSGSGPSVEVVSHPTPGRRVTVGVLFLVAQLCTPYSYSGQTIWRNCATLWHNCARLIWLNCDS